MKSRASQRAHTAGVLHTVQESLAWARSAGATISSQRAITMPEGYQIGEAFARERLAAGWHRVGWKLGFTNQSQWAMLGLDQPFHSPVYSETLAADRIDFDGLVQPRIEPEIVLGLAHDLEQGSELDAIAAAVAWVAVGLEVVHCHFEGWKMSPAEAVADAGLHAALAIGPRRKVPPDEVRGLSAYECDLLCNGKPVSRGRGRDVLGGPLEALGWLLRGLPSGLPGGEIITTGTLSRAEPVLRGQRWTHRALQPRLLGAVELLFS